MDNSNAAMTVQQAADRLLDLNTPEEEPETVEEPQEEQELEAEAEEVDAEDQHSDDEEGDQEEPAEDPNLHKVRVDGEEIEVPYDELLSGYSRFADYQRKTTALGEEKRAFEREREEVTTLRAQYVEVLPKLRAQVENALGPEPDWDALRAQNPEQAQWAWIQRQEAKQALAAAQQTEEAERQALLLDQQRKMQEYVAAEQQKLAATLPDLDAPALATYGQTLGFTQQEIGSIADHRMIVTLHKAMLYDQAVASKQTIKPTRQGTKSATPGSKDSVPNTKSRKREQAEQRFKKSGSIDDAVRLLSME
jgi:hypothetical protein